jgi:hypothetical protein
VQHGRRTLARGFGDRTPPTFFDGGRQNELRALREALFLVDGSGKRAPCDIFRNFLSAAGNDDGDKWFGPWRSLFLLDKANKNMDNHLRFATWQPI